MQLDQQKQLNANTSASANANANADANVNTSVNSSIDAAKGGAGTPPLPQQVSKEGMGAHTNGSMPTMANGVAATSNVN